MEPDPQRESRFPLFGSVTIPAVLLIGLAAVSRLGTDISLRSVRPKRLQSQEERRLTPPLPLHAVYSRLWEDPIVVAERDAIAYTRNSTVGSEKDVSKEASRDRREEQLKAHRSQVSSLQSYFRGLLRRPAEREQRAKLLLLPVMVPGSPYSEDAEQRKRTRYAVVSALGRAGYQLSYPTRVSYVHVPVNVAFAAGRKYEVRELVMPVKLYTPRKVRDSTGQAGTQVYEKVLVCWVNEDAIGDDPVDVLEQIAEALFGCNQSALDRHARAPVLAADAECDEEACDTQQDFDLKVLGPANSDTLRKIVDPSNGQADGMQQSATCFLKNQSPEILVTRATVTSDNLPEVNGATPEFDDPGSSLELDRAPFCLQRIIGTDRTLAESIAGELINRSIAPDKDNLVVLLTERDSLYGAAFPAIFRDAVDILSERQPEASAPASKRPSERVHMITYLRGLDGMALVQNGSEASEDEIDRPEGRSQYDYIRRIKEQITAIEDAAAKEQHGAGFSLRRPAVRAIGVVGTDVYDKLLLLRSLRNHFPNVVFFTTDLDATFSYRKEYAHTRNLIVASHFGLNLHADLQGDVLPFRGSYQTSTFLATLHAVDFRDLPELTKATVAPLLFEIGRNGPYQLTHVDPDSRIQPPGRQQSQPSAASVLAWVMLLLWLGVIVGFQFDRPRKVLLFLINYDPFGARSSRRILVMGVLNATCVVSLAVGTTLGIAWFSRRELSEPFSLTEGISAWPGIIIAFVAAVFAVMALGRVFLGIRNQTHFAAALCERALGKVPTCSTTTLDRLYRWRIVDSAKPPAITTLMSEFLAQCHPSVQMKRVMSLSASYAFFGGFVWALTSHDLFGVREPALQWASWFITLCAFILFILVAATTIDSVQVCRLLIKRLGAGVSGWGERADANDQHEDYKDEHEAGAIKSVALIAATTERVSGMIWYTFITAFLLLAAQYPYFEFYAIPWSTCVIIIPLIVGNVVSYILLRHGAERARDSIVASLRLRPLLTTNQSDTTKEAMQVISEIRTGALSPLPQDPLVKALSVPLGGTTGLLALEQVLRTISG